jgi:tetratricopeptide (TPR) repeat protein
MPSLESADIGPYEAVQLFLSSARRVRPDYEPTRKDLARVAEICRLVEGMPLALLLAAAWMEMLTPTEIATEISQSLDFLESDLRDAPERQRSMRAVFDHSWNLLSERQQEVLAGLSVFCGSFARQAAQQVTGASLRELMTLVSRSLLHRAPVPSTAFRSIQQDRQGGPLRPEGRYEMHELLRQYAAEKLNRSLDAGRAVCDRHSAFYAATLEQWATDLKGARQQAALAEIDADVENVRAAWDWAVDRGQIKQLSDALEGLCLFYRWRVRYQEGEAACRIASQSVEKQVATASRNKQILAKILVWQSFFSWRSGRTELAEQILRRSMDLLDGPELADQDIRPEMAFALWEMAEIAEHLDNDQARQLYAQSLALYRTLDDRWGMANALWGVGSVTNDLGAYEEAERLQRESLTIRRVLGDQRGMAWSLLKLAQAVQDQGQLEEAEHLERESLAISRAVDERAATETGLIYLGWTLAWRGKYAKSYSVLEECVAMCSDMPLHRESAYANILLGTIEVYLGRYKQARKQVQIGLALAQEVEWPWGIKWACFQLGRLALAEGGWIQAQQLFQESAHILDHPTDTASCVLAYLGCTELRVGNPCQAQQCLCRALQTLAEHRSFIWQLSALPAVALSLAYWNQPERAVELYALASSYPYVANSRWYEEVAGQEIDALAAKLPPEVIAAAKERGRARDLWATVEELSAELEGNKKG